MKNVKYFTRVRIKTPGFYEGAQGLVVAAFDANKKQIIDTTPAATLTVLLDAGQRTDYLYGVEGWEIEVLY